MHSLQFFLYEERNIYSWIVYGPHQEIDLENFEDLM